MAIVDQLLEALSCPKDDWDVQHELWVLEHVEDDLGVGFVQGWTL